MKKSENQGNDQREFTYFEEEDCRQDQWNLQEESQMPILPSVKHPETEQFGVQFQVQDRLEDQQLKYAIQEFPFNDNHSSSEQPMNLELSEITATSSFDSTRQHTSSGIQRISSKMQSNIQKILTAIKKGHILKNVPSQLWRKIRNGILLLSRQHQIEVFQKGIVNQFWNKKRLTIDELTLFIQTTEFSNQIWSLILNEEEINRMIERSNKLSTSKHFTGKYEIHRNFLKVLNKRIEKIIYRSVRRVIERLRHGDTFKGYLDSEAQIELHKLDNEYAQSTTYSQNYNTILSLIN